MTPCARNTERRGWMSLDQRMFSSRDTLILQQHRRYVKEEIIIGYNTMYTLTARGTKLTEQTVEGLNRWLHERNIINYALRMPFRSPAPCARAPHQKAANPPAHRANSSDDN